MSTFTLNSCYPALLHLSQHYTPNLIPYYHHTCKTSVDLHLFAPLPFHPITSNITLIPQYTYASLLALLLASFPHHSFHSSSLFFSISTFILLYLHSLYLTPTLLFIFYLLLILFLSSITFPFSLLSFNSLSCSPSIIFHSFVYCMAVASLLLFLALSFPFPLSLPFFSLSLSLLLSL